MTIAALAEVVGGNLVSSVVDFVARPIVPGWKDMSCTSRGMWVGTAAGSAAGYLAAIKSPKLAAAIAPFAGTLSTTQYIEGCVRSEGTGSPARTP